MSRLIKFQVRLQNLERGATAIEYALMVSLIALVIIAAVTFFGTQVSGLINSDATRV